MAEGEELSLANPRAWVCEKTDASASKRREKHFSALFFLCVCARLSPPRRTPMAAVEFAPGWQRRLLGKIGGAGK